MSTDSTTRVTYALTPDDLFAYYKDLLLYRPTGWLTIFVVYIFLLDFLIMAVALLLPELAREGILGPNLATAAVFAVIYFLLGWTYLRRFARRSHKLRQGMRDAWHLEISPTGVASSAEMGHGTVNWTAIERIVSSRQHIFLYFDKINPVIIPRRAFASPAAAEAFLRAAKAWHAAATAKR